MNEYEYIKDDLIPLCLFFWKDKDKIINNLDNDLKFKRRKNQRNNRLYSNSSIMTKEQVIFCNSYLKNRV